LTPRLLYGILVLFKRRHLTPQAPEQPHTDANTAASHEGNPEHHGVEMAAPLPNRAVFAAHLATSCQIVAGSCRFCRPQRETSRCHPRQTGLNSVFDQYSRGEHASHNIKKRQKRQC
jgi:hypothetical protein